MSAERKGLKLFTFKDGKVSPGIGPILSDDRHQNYRPHVVFGEKEKAHQIFLVDEDTGPLVEWPVIMLASVKMQCRPPRWTSDGALKSDDRAQTWILGGYDTVEDSEVLVRIRTHYGPRKSNESKDSDRSGLWEPIVESPENWPSTWMFLQIDTGNAHKVREWRDGLVSFGLGQALKVLIDNGEVYRLELTTSGLVSEKMKS